LSDLYVGRGGKEGGKRGIGGGLKRKGSRYSGWIIERKKKRERKKDRKKEKKCT